MLIGGLQKNSLIDYPGKIAAVVFTQGCPWRCPYCYNPALVLPERFSEPMPETRLFAFLKKRAGQIEGVVVSGGEPTVQPDLPEFLRKIRGLGYLVKLDTNGCRPLVLRSVIAHGLVDFIAMDIKAPLENYPLATGTRVEETALRESISIIIHSGLDHEFRTTVIPGLHTLEELRAIGSLVRGARRFTLQQLISDHTLHPAFQNRPSFPAKPLEALKDYFRQRVRIFSLRYAPADEPQAVLAE